MVIAIMLTGIIAGMVSVFMVRPIQGYLDTAQRAELSDVADMVLRRLSREARQALPNSIRCGSAAGLCGTTAYNGLDYYFIEFIPASGGGSYRDEHDGSAGGIPLNFTDTGSCAVTRRALCQFDVIGPMPAAPALAVGDFIVVVFNFGEVSGISQAPFNAHANNDDCTNCNRARVTDIAGNTVTLNPGGRRGQPLCPGRRQRSLGQRQHQPFSRGAGRGQEHHVCLPGQRSRAHGALSRTTASKRIWRMPLPPPHVAARRQCWPMRSSAPSATRHRRHCSAPAC
jgi:type II secretory pathway pseudopilin PulG